MAKVGVIVAGDSAGAQAAFRATAASALRMGEDVSAVSAKIVTAQARQLASIRENITAYQALAAGAAAGSDEQVAALSKVGQAQARLAATMRQTTYAQDAQAASAKEAAAKQIAAAEKIGRGLTTMVTAPTLLVGAAAVKMGVDFQQQMLLIQTQAGASAREVHNLSGQVLELARSSALGPTELAQGLYHLESVGLRGSEAMKVLKVSSDAAFMGIANLETVTTALGAAVASGISGAQDYQQAMGTLDATIGAGNMRMEDLAGALGNVLAPAKNAGVTLPELGAAMAVLTDRGMGADEAATRLRMTFALMQAPSNKAIGALKDMGISAEQLGTMIRQPNGLLNVLELLHKQMQTVGSVRGSEDILRAFGGGRSGAGILTLVQSLDSAISSYQGKLTQIEQQSGQFAAKVAVSQQSAAYKMHQAWSNVQVDLVKLGGALAPAAVAAAQAVGKIADAFNALPGPVKTDLGVLVGVLAVGGPLLLAVSGVAKAVATIGAAFTTSAAEATTATAVMEADMATLVGRIGAYTGGAAAAGGAAAGAGLAATIGGVVITGGLGILDYQLGKNALTTPATAAFAAGAKASPYQKGSYLDDVYQAALAGNTASLAQLKVPAHGPAAAALLLGQTARQSIMNSPAGLQSYPEGIGVAGFPAATSRAPGAPALTAAQQLQLGLASNPSDTGLLHEQIARNTSTMAWLKRRFEAGKIDATQYMKAALPLASQIASDQSALATATHAAARASAAARGDTVRRMIAAAAPFTGSYKMPPWMLREFFPLKIPNNVTGSYHYGGNFALPPGLQVAMARAQALNDPARVAKIAAEDKAFAEKLLRLNHLTWQGKIDAYNAIVQADQILGTGTVKVADKVSAIKMAARLGLTGGARVAGAAALAQWEAHSGHVPTVIGLQGIAARGGGIVVHTSIKLHGREIAKAVTTHQQKQRMRTAVQSSGPFAGKVMP